MTGRMMTLEKYGHQVPESEVTMTNIEAGSWVPTQSLIYTATQMSPFNQVTNCKECDKNEKLGKYDQTMAPLFEATLKYRTICLEPKYHWQKIYE